MKLLFILILLITSLAAFGAGEMPVTFNLAGRLYDSPTSTNPLLAQDVEIKVQILDAAKACILYEEKQVVDTDTSDGHFAILVGSSYPSAKRGTLDAQNSMATIFQNTTDIPARGCAGNLSTKVAKSGRYMRVIVTPDGGSADTLTPEIFIGNVPMALVAETLGGLTKDQFLQLKDPATSELTQSNLENIFSSNNYPILADLMDGTVPASGLSTENDYLIVADSASPGSGEIQLAIGASVKAKVTNAGDFVANNRIGVGVDAPTYDLSFGGATNRVLGIERRTTASGAAGSSLSVVAGGAAVTGSNRAGGDLYLSSGVSTGNQASRIFFQTPTPGSSGTSDNTPFTRMALDGDGQLGIGNSAPARPIHISSASAPTILLDNTAAGSDLKRRYVTGTLTGDLAFGKFSDDMSTTTEHMRILSNGNVGIGITSPTSNIHIVSNSAQVKIEDTSGASSSLALRTNTSDFSITTTQTSTILAGGVGDSMPIILNGSGQSNQLVVASSGNIGIGTTTPASKFHIGVAPTGTDDYGLVSLGSAPFDGSTSGFFTGHASGTILAANAATGFAGDFINMQIGGVTKFKVDKDGIVSTGGNISQTGTSTFSTGTGTISLNGPTTIAANQNFVMAAGTGTSTQTYNGTTSDASTISANNLTSGSILNLTSSSTAAASGNTGLNIAISGVNATSGITRKGISSVMTSTGASSTNVAGYFSATGATNNYGLVVPNGNVGIGLSDPAYAFQVESDTGVGSGEHVLSVFRKNSSGTGFVMGYQADGFSQNYGFLRASNNADLGVGTTGNNKILYISNRNVVGIGTTTPQGTFDVVGSSRFGSIGPATATTFGTAPTSTDTVLTVVSTAGYPPTGLLYLTNNNVSEVVSYTGTSATTFNNVVRGLYGTTARSWNTGDTADLVTNLVAGSNASVAPRMILTQTKGMGYGRVPDGWVGAGSTQYNGLLYSGGGIQTSTMDVGMLFGQSTAWIKGTGGSSSAIDQIRFGTNSIERARIDGNGNVIVGSTTPIGKLTVTDGSTAQASVTGINPIVSAHANGPVYYLGKDQANGIEFVFGTSSLGAAFTGSTSNHPFHLRTNNVTRMLLHTNGNIGMGVTAPTEKLQVAGNIAPEADGTRDLGTTALKFRDIYATNNVINTSDAREKKNIRDSDLGLNFIQKLRPVSYSWISGSDEKIHYGLIAQETEKLLGKSSHKAIVHYDEKTDKYGIRYTELISPIIKGIQELLSKVLGVESRVEELKMKTQKLEKENAEMKSQLNRIERMLRAQAGV